MQTHEGGKEVLARSRTGDVNKHYYGAIGSFTMYRSKDAVTFFSDYSSLSLSLFSTFQSHFTQESDMMTTKRREVLARPRTGDMN